MSRVHILTPEVISKIAAGEVIERPASVIKELIENSLDAGSGDIEISIKKSGKTSIRIKDSGSGIEPDDIEKIFKRHSTSKIKTADDIFKINSLGFRGEALFSIAAISDITLRSKSANNDSGWEIHLRAGEILNKRPVSMNDGTDIEIKELFFNTPARKKFLKSDPAELTQILNVFTPYTLLYPEKHFKITSEEKTLLDLAPEKNTIARIKKALNLDPTHILEAEKEILEQNISIRLIMGDINIQRARKNLQFIFVNQRPVQNRSVNFHMNNVYRLIFPIEVRPFFIVYITVPPEEVDTNIHPTKHEVKIKDEARIIPLLRTLCEHTLMSQGKPKEMLSTLFKDTQNSSYIAPPPKERYISPLKEKQVIFKEEKMSIPGESSDLKNKLSLSLYIGGFLNKYLFFESAKSLIIIDQHAAQERVTYEKLITAFQSGTIETQRLLTPDIVELSSQEMLAWGELKDMLGKIGIETTLWDSKAVALHTHPQLIKKPELALRNVLSGEKPSTFDIDTVARKACRESVTAGDKMVQAEAQYLRDRLMECLDPFTCPHGRPTVIEIKENIFEKEFLRK